MRGRTMGLESRSVLERRGTQNTMRQRKSNFRVVELFGVLTATILRVHFLDVHNLNRPEGGVVLSGHVTVHLIYCACARYVTVLLVQVVVVVSALITQPDAIILHYAWVAFFHFVDAEQLTMRMLNFAKGTKIMPESRFGNDVICGKQAHSINFRIWILGRRLVATHNNIFVIRHMLSAQTLG